MATPLKMTPEMMDRIIDLLMDGQSVRAICELPDMPHRTTVTAHLATDEAFAKRYAAAKALGIEHRFEGMRADIIANKADPAIARLLWDNERWQLSKLDAKKYGDKQAVEHSGAIGITITSDDADL